MRLIFMGTAEFALPSLRTLILSGYDIPLVVTQPDQPAGRGKRLKPSPVKLLADEFGIDILQPVKLKDSGFLGNIKRLQPDIIVVVAYGRILPEEVLNLPSLGCVNLHGSLLPAYRGAAPIQRSLMAGEEVVGVSTMHMDKTMDTGDIILQKSLSLNGDEDYGEVSQVLAEMGGALLLDTLEQLEWGIAPRIPQDHEQATYAPPLTREDELIKWELRNLVLKNQIRGLSPSPGAYTWFMGNKIKVFKAEIVESKGGTPGEVMELIPNRGFIVQTGDGGLLVLEVQREGKKRIPAGDFMRGCRLKPGDTLG